MSDRKEGSPAHEGEKRQDVHSQHLLLQAGPLASSLLPWRQEEMQARVRPRAPGQLLNCLTPRRLQTVLPGGLGESMLITS